MELQIFTVLDPATRDPVIKDIRDPTCRLWSGHIQKAREVFERVGVYVQTTVPDKLPMKFEVIKMQQPSGVDQVMVLNTVAPNILPKNDEQAGVYASRVFTSLEVKMTGNRPLSVMYVPYDKDSKDTGVDIWDADFLLVNSNDFKLAKLDTLLAHELGHALMPKTRNKGHWLTPFPDWLHPEKPYDAPNHKFRFDFKGNLLLAELGRDASAIDTIVDEVRLWDFPDAQGFRELAELSNNANQLLKKL